jgi:hypothetical protein
VLGGGRPQGDDVVLVLERLRFELGVPKRIYCNNVAFVRAALTCGRYTSGVALDTARRLPATIDDTIDPSRAREECLIVHSFASLERRAATQTLSCFDLRSLYFVAITFTSRPRVWTIVIRDKSQLRAAGAGVEWHADRRSLVQRRRRK